MENNNNKIQKRARLKRQEKRGETSHNGSREDRRLYFAETDENNAYTISNSRNIESNCYE